MQLRNKIINYYVGMPSEVGGSARVFNSPITINDKIARDLINKQLKLQKKPPLPSSFPLLHVCFDYDSSILYIPNSQDFTREQINSLLPAAKLRITNDFGGYANRPPIEGSPFSSLRVRSINSFGFARKVISEHFKGKVFKDMPVVEAFLDRMPRTIKMLPPIYKNPQYLGGYISPSQVGSITFVDEIDIHGNKRKEPKILLTQKAPFILINTSVSEHRKEPTATEREWVVLEGYRNYLYDGEVVQKEEKYISEDLSSFADLYAIKRQLYAGWPFEEVCAYLLNDVDNFGSLMKATDRLMTAAIAVAKEGNKNPAESPYYISFQIDKDFPFNISSLINEQGKVDTSRQYPFFILMDYDTKNSSVLIRTTVYIPPHICKKVLKAKNEPLIARYNSIANKIDVKSEPRSYTAALQERNQLGKIKSVISNKLDEDKKKTLGFRVGDLARGRSSVDPTVTTIRRISDYPMTCDFIKKVCKEYNVEFKDIDVVIGPMEQIMGRPGVSGGFMDAKLFKQNKMKTPFELTNGIWISPPVIMVDSIEHPSYAEQTETLAHEYTHNIYSILHPEYSVTYNMGDQGSGKQEDEYKQWFKYFSDPSEIEAHKVNIRFELGIGKSYDEIIRNKVGGAITMENYPIALKFAQLVKEVMKQMEREEEANEEPAGERQRDRRANPSVA